MSRHKCWGYLPEVEFGVQVFSRIESPITECVELPDGRLVAGEAGVGTQVNFCPFCGWEARIQPEAIPYDRDDALDDLDEG